MAPDGRFYRTGQWEHDHVAAVLRATGDGPAERWNMRDGWVMVRSTGEVVSLPEPHQAQLDALSDMLQAAPDSVWRSNLIESLRKLREIELRRS